MELNTAPNKLLPAKNDPHITDHKSLSPKTEPGFKNPNRSENLEKEKHDYNQEDLHQGSAKAEIENLESEKSKETTLRETVYEFLRKAIPIPGALASSAAHLSAALYHLANLKSNKRENIDNTSLWVSKIALGANCILQTIEAIKHNRALEAFSRFIEPLFIFAENRVEDLGLARGIGLGISQLVGSQEGIFNELAKQKWGIDVTHKNSPKLTMGQDLDLNFAAFKKIFVEMVKGGIGSGRRFLTGFSLEAIKTRLTNLMNKFNLSSLKDLFDSSHGDYRARFTKFLESSGLAEVKELFKGNEVLDKGHTDALSGYLMIFGSILGYLDKASKGLLYKVGGTIRNLGGAVADIALFAHPEPDMNISSMFLSINTVMDIFQRFIPAKLLNLILPWSNFSMAAYNIGVAIYLNRSNKKSNEGDKIAYYDTDLSNQSNRNIEIDKTESAPREQMKSMAVAA